ncbi:MAG: cobaltochelatase subunit CobS, partial [Gluconacetobacter diazotrophicus]|nr:cobaltochelatase subunit CobS [Gluconacetobacter diazotrophicus]
MVAERDEVVPVPGFGDAGREGLPPIASLGLPDRQVSVRETFGIDSDLAVPGYSVRTEHVPDVDPAYRFDRDTTLAILAGFAHNRRVMIQGYHGTGKSSHVEQVAARLNWPCVRINLDSHI